MACGEQHGVRLWAAESLCAAPAPQQGQPAGEPQAGRAGDQALQHMEVRSLRASGDAAWPRNACGMCMGSMLPAGCQAGGMQGCRHTLWPGSCVLQACAAPQHGADAGLLGCRRAPPAEATSHGPAAPPGRQSGLLKSHLSQARPAPVASWHQQCCAAAGLCPVCWAGPRLSKLQPCSCVLARLAE